MSLTSHNFNDPFLDRTIRHMHRLVDEPYRYSSEVQPWTGQSGGLWRPVVDVRENDKNIVVHAELPGVKKEDITIDVSEGTLTLSGEKREEKKEDNERYHRVERSYGKFTRQFNLPEGVNTSQICACFNNGVLELTIPKPEKREAKKRIDIK